MGKQGKTWKNTEYRENLGKTEKHEKTGRIRGKTQKNMGKQVESRKNRKTWENRGNVEKHGKTGRIWVKQKNTRKQ